MQLQNKICIITGATSGIGKETAIALAKKGVKLVLPVRNMNKGEAVREEIHRLTGNGHADLYECDLSSMASIRSFAAGFYQKYDRLDLLINNAGIWETKRTLSADGIEKNFAVNHLAPFLLTRLMIDALKAGAPARVVNVASAAHIMGRINFDDPEGKKSWGSFRSYAQSKLANILFTRRLARELEGEGVVVNCLHPGVVNTRLFDNLPEFLINAGRFMMINPETGARTSVYLASAPEISHITGEYFSGKKIVRTTKLARSREAADRLWEISLKYVE